LENITNECVSNFVEVLRRRCLKKNNATQMNFLNEEEYFPFTMEREMRSTLLKWMQKASPIALNDVVEEMMRKSEF